MNESSESGNGLRTALSFALFVHLFALFVAVSSNVPPVSPLRAQLTTVPFLDAYAEMLNMNTGYNFEISDYTRMENEESAWLYTDHFLEVELNWTGESAENPQRLVFSPSGQGRNFVAQKYRNLLREVSLRLDDQAESVLPNAIMERFLQEQEITEGKHRVRLCHWQPLNMAEVQAVEAAARDPFGAARRIVVYEADVSFYEGEMVYTRAASAFEVAPRRGRGN